MFSAVLHLFSESGKQGAVGLYNFRELILVLVYVCEECKTSKMGFCKVFSGMFRCQPIRCFLVVASVNCTALLLALPISNNIQSVFQTKFINNVH